MVQKIFSGFVGEDVLAKTHWKYKALELSQPTAPPKYPKYQAPKMWGLFESLEDSLEVKWKGDGPTMWIGGNDKWVHIAQTLSPSPCEGKNWQEGGNLDL